MIVAKIQVNDAIANTVYRKVIPAGIIGAQVQFDYAADLWAGLHKTVVFRCEVTKDVITDADVVTIPSEVVAKHGYPLRVGVYGVDADGNIAIPTIWADLGTVRDAADPSGDTTTDQSLPVWEQVRQLMTDLAEQSAGSAKAAQEAAEQSAESRDAAVESEEHSAASEREAQEAAAVAKKSAAAAGQSAKAAAASESGAALSANTASAEAQAAKGSADKAAQSQAAAQSALQGMVYVTFTVGANGHVLIRNGDLLGSTVFSLTPAGHLEVDY